MMTEDTLDVFVSDKKACADGVYQVNLVSASGGRLPEWEPGAHIELDLPNGLRRQYSLSSDPSDTEAWRIGVLRESESRGGSLYVCDSLEIGARLSIRGPRNNFPLHAAPRYLFIAGGIGITPLLPMIRSAERAGADWTLIYGGRTRSSMAFLEELSIYGDRVKVLPQDERGLLPLESLLDGVDKETMRSNGMWTRAPACRFGGRCVRARAHESPSRTIPRSPGGDCWRSAVRSPLRPERRDSDGLSGSVDPGGC